MENMPISCKMRTSLIMILAFAYFTGSAAQNGGGINMKISQHGLNRAITYVLEHELVPYIENDLDVKDYNFSLGAATLLIEKLTLNTLEGQHASIEILDGNKITITVGFSKLGLAANLTRIAPSDIIYAPNTVVFFGDCSLKVTFLLGMDQNNDVTLDSCKASIGSFSAEGELGSALEGVYSLGGSDSIATLVEQICPSLENITNGNLDEILSVEDTVKITSRKYGDISVNMKLISISTESNIIDIKVEVTAGSDPLVGNVKFPADLQGGNDAKLLINDKILDIIAKHTMQGNVFKGFQLQKTIEKDVFTIQVNEGSIKNTVTSSSDGMSVIWHVTFNIFTKDNCLVYQLTLDSVTPLVFAYNDTMILVEADQNRLQKDYNVSHWNKTCLKNVEKLDKSKDIQLELLRHTDSAYEKRLVGQNFEMRLPKGNWYGFNNARINTLKDGVVFSSALRVGNITDMKEEVLKRVYNKHYETNLTVYVYSDGERVEVDGRISTVDSGVMATLNINLLASSVILIFCFNRY